MFTLASDLLRLSRPRFWLYTAGPFLIGSATLFPEHFWLWPNFWLGLFIFLLPANLWMYGVNDLADSDTDQYNNKKQGYELAWKKEGGNIKAKIIFLSGALVLVYGWWQGILPGLVSTLFLFLSGAYSLPPMRLKARPFADSLSNIFYILPALILVAPADWSWLALAAGASWTTGMHLFSALPDIDADSRAGLQTTATVFGKKWGLLAVGLCWLLTAFLAGVISPWLIFSFIYPIFITIIAKSKKPLDHWYRVYPYLNCALGFALFWTVILML